MLLEDTMITQSKFTQSPPEGYNITEKYFVAEFVYWTGEPEVIGCVGFDSFWDAHKYSTNSEHISYTFRNKEV